MFVLISKYIFSKFPNVFVNFIKCRRGLLGKNLSAKGVLANFPTTLLLLLLQNFIKYEVKLFRQSPMLTQELGLRALSFLSKLLQFTTFSTTKKFKQTSKKLRVCFYAFKQIMHDHHAKIVSAPKSCLLMAFKFDIFIRKCLLHKKCFVQ